jgi:MoaA/NifB/PqqE/SkfB family radical SAM enzyme
MRSAQNPEDLPLGTAVKILEGARKYNTRLLALTGGEPFLYPALGDLVDRAVSLRYRLGFVTNGYNLLEHETFLRRHKKSIAYVAFSLESPRPEEHDAIRHKGSFQRLMADFEFCRREKITFRVQTTVSRRNLNDLLDIGLLAKKKGAAHLSFTTMLPCPRTEENQLVLDTAQRAELPAALIALGRTLGMPTNIAADIRGKGNLTICQSMEMKELSVDPQGRLIQCCELGNYDTPHIQRQAVVADCNQEPFDDAMKKLCLHFHRMTIARIADLAARGDRDESPDFNSCFYCVHKALAGPVASPGPGV